LKISEIFYSIQGEGKRSGYPSFFIRTNFCNLRCNFSGGNLCDTAYTSWNPDDKENLGIISIDEIISEYKKFFTNDVVITGGEPAMQSDELKELCIKLKQVNNSVFITIETNGTIYDEFAQFTNLMSISPKLKSSIPYSTEYENMHSANRINIETLTKFHRDYENKIYDIQWKFVICDENDINEIIELQKLIGFKNENIFLMPEGISEEEITGKRKIVSELCLKYEMNYTDRLHILLWGNKRGT